MKISEKPIIKLVASIVMILIMGVIIYFVFNYYNDVAKNNSSKEEEKEDKEEKDSLEILEFEKYNFKRQTVSVNGKVFTLNVIKTDAGELLSVNDNAVDNINIDDNSDIFYAILNDYLVIKNVNEEESSLLIIDDNANLVKGLFNIKDKYFNYVLYKPLFINEYSNYILKDKDNIYVTYTLNNNSSNIILNNGKTFEELKYEEYDKYNIKDNTLVQYTLKINCQTFNEEKIKIYNFADYVNNKD